MRKRRLIESFYNWISMAGALIALTAFGVTLTMMMLEWASGRENIYLGIVTYIAMPAVLIFGLLLIPFGMWRVRRKEQRADLPTLDLNNPKHRLTATIFTIGSMVLIVFTSFGTYEVYEFSESNAFCGETCHAVMTPQATTNQHSSHAEVECVTCHVGSGATHYLKAKLNGVNQLIGVLTGDYARPVRLPAHGMRTGKEICQSCHVPENDHGLYHQHFERYKMNKKSSRHVYDLLIDVGGFDRVSGEANGAHWHVFNKVEYAATDELMQEIPWMQVTYTDQSTRVFAVEGASKPEGALHNVDCTTCHNRKGHEFATPFHAVDAAITKGYISHEIPRIKAASIEALAEAAKAEDKTNGLAAIGEALRTYYDDEDPDVLDEFASQLDVATQSLKDIYQANYYPEMKSNWTSHPNNMGHFYAPGCARCHDGKHQADDGETLSYECSGCHTIIAYENPKGELTSDLTGLEYVHPDPDEEDWTDTPCYECHGP